MDQKQRTKRFGICVILWAILFRLILAGISSIPAYSETGQDVRFLSSSGKRYDHVRESPPPWIPKQEKPGFSSEDAAMVTLSNSTARKPDLETLMALPLDWDLTGEEPAVLILHTHATESYTKAGENYTESALYRTLDERYNMLSIGDAVEEILEEHGIAVIHDRQLHDYPSYNGSYVHARTALEEYLESYPSIQLVLDLHRDASESADGQLRTEAVVNGQTSAQLMLVVGTDVSRPSHTGWEDNLSLALKLEVQLERLFPGITRPINLRTQRFNQDLCPGALLVEVGAAGNSHAEALRAARALAEAVVSMADGVQTK